MRHTNFLGFLLLLLLEDSISWSFFDCSHYEPWEIVRGLEESAEKLLSQQFLEFQSLRQRDPLLCAAQPFHGKSPGNIGLSLLYAVAGPNGLMGALENCYVYRPPSDETIVWTRAQAADCPLHFKSADCLFLSYSTCGVEELKPVDYFADKENVFMHEIGNKTVDVCRIASLVKKPYVWVYNQLVQYVSRYSTFLESRISEYLSSNLKLSYPLSRQPGTLFVNLRGDRLHSQATFLAKLDEIVRIIDFKVASLTSNSNNYNSGHESPVHTVFIAVATVNRSRVTSATLNTAYPRKFTFQVIHISDIFAQRDVDIQVDLDPFHHYPLAGAVSDDDMVIASRSKQPPAHIVPSSQGKENEATATTDKNQQGSDGVVLSDVEAALVEYFAAVELAVAADIYLGGMSSHYLLVSALRRVRHPTRPIQHTCCIRYYKLLCEGSPENAVVWKWFFKNGFNDSMAF